MKIFITGGAGFVGRHITSSLIKNGYSVTVFDNFSNSKYINNGSTIIKGDIMDYESLVESSKDHNCVIHLAAKISVQESVRDPKATNLVNVNGTINVLRACLKNKIKKIIVASTAAVYGDNKNPNIILTENTKTLPLSPYGVSKLEMESQVKKFAINNDLSCIVLRFFNIYGSGQTNEYAGVISKFMHNIKIDMPLTIYGDGNQTRDFISIHDVVSAFYCSIKNISRHKFAIYNIATGRSTSIISLARIMLNIAKKDLQIKFSPPREADIRYSNASITLAKKEIGFMPQVDLQEGLRDLFRSHMQNSV